MPGDLIVMVYIFGMGAPEKDTSTVMIVVGISSNRISLLASPLSTSSPFTLIVACGLAATKVT